MENEPHAYVVHNEGPYPITVPLGRSEWWARLELGPGASASLVPAPLPPQRVEPPVRGARHQSRLALSPLPLAPHANTWTREPYYGGPGYYTKQRRLDDELDAYMAQRPPSPRMFRVPGGEVRPHAGNM